MYRRVEFGHSCRGTNAARLQCGRSRSSRRLGHTSQRRSPVTTPGRTRISVSQSQKAPPAHLPNYGPYSRSSCNTCDRNPRSAEDTSERRGRRRRHPQRLFWSLASRVIFPARPPTRIGTRKLIDAESGAVRETGPNDASRCHVGADDALLPTHRECLRTLRRCGTSPGGLSSAVVCRSLDVHGRPRNRADPSPRETSSARPPRSLLPFPSRRPTPDSSPAHAPATRAAAATAPSP